MLEVIKALAKLENASFSDVVKVADEKCDKRGGFEDKYF